VRVLVYIFSATMFAVSSKTGRAIPCDANYTPTKEFDVVLYKHTVIFNSDEAKFLLSLVPDCVQSMIRVQSAFRDYHTKITTLEAWLDLFLSQGLLQQWYLKEDIFQSDR
jgi:hypothetical protein